MFAREYEYVVPSTLSPDDFAARVYTHLIAGDGSGPAFPKELYPDAWCWTKDLSPDEQPMEVPFIPKGSWIAARLSYFAGTEDKLKEHLTSQRRFVDRHLEFQLSLDVRDGTNAIGVIGVHFNLDEIRLEGRLSTPEHAKAVPDDIRSVLFDNALDDVAECSLALEEHKLGWNGETFIGAGLRPSRFALIREDEKVYEDLARRSVEFPKSDDTLANQPEVLERIGEYLAVESADCEFIEANLKYIRSAIIEDTHYWIWEYYESDNNKCYVTVSMSPTQNILGMRDAWEFSPEQYIYGDYHGIL